jgi:glycosyltransferase involved in cell wall biosynthesis
LEQANDGDLSVKVLHVVQNMSAGGLEKVVLDLCIQLKQLGHEPTVFIYESKRDWVKLLEEFDIPFILTKIKRDGFDTSIVKELSQVLPDYDVVHSHDIGPMIYTGLSLVKMLFGKKPRWIHTTHGLITIQESRKYVLYEMIVARFCHKIVAVSDEIEKFYIQDIGLASERVRKIYNGVDFSHHFTKENLPLVQELKAKYFNQLNLDQNLKTAICVGRINKNKNQIWLSKILSHHKNWQLLVVGPFSDESSEQEANTILAKNIHFLGPRLDIKELILISDVFINPSHSEGLPLVILEALSTKTPVIASEIEGHLSLNQDQKLVELFQLNEIELKQALERYMALSESQYDFAKSKYSIARMAKDYLEIYRD